MHRLLMISGDRTLAKGKKGAFYNTLEEFYKHWDRIDVITYPIWGGTATSYYFGNAEIHPSPWPRIFQPLFIFFKGMRLFRKYRFDVMVANEHASFLNGVGAKLLHWSTNVPYMLEVLHVPGYPRAGNWKEVIYRFLMRLLIRWDTQSAAVVRIINKQIGEFLVCAGVPRSKIALVPAFYIDLETFHPVEGVKKYDYIFVGRLERNKGPNLFVEAVQKLGGYALIVGDGSLRQQLQATSYKLKANVTFHGWARDAAEVAGLINESKVLVMPSYNEGGPRVVLEAMACGVPVLATPVGIVPEVIQDGMSGIIIDWDAEDIAEKAKQLLQDRDTYRRISSAGLEIVKQFEKKAAIRNYAEKLQNLIP